MKNKYLNWNTLIYALILINIAIIILYVVMTKSDIFLNIISNQDYISKSNNNIFEKFNYAYKYETYINSNWSWFTDSIKCPSSVSLSWSAFSWNISTKAYYNSNSDSFYCLWNFNSYDLILNYNNTFTWFTDVTYNFWWCELALLWWIYSCTADNSDNTIISFTEDNSLSWIDSNFNSDDYSPNSSWSIEYPNLYLDDDDLARKTIYWYIANNSWLYNIFWNNYKTNDYIAKNSNNDNTLSAKIWDVTDWLLYLDIDNAYKIKIIEFDRLAYKNYKKLSNKNEWEWESLTWAIWYITYDSWITLSWSLSGAMKFDFKDKDYAIFLSFTWSSDNILDMSRYKLTWKNASWSWIYLNPINDSNPSDIKYLWSDIIIDDWNYFGNIYELGK